MPLKPNVHKVLMIGSGPIVIGQAAEFDYAGTQACRALKEEGMEVVLVNSNPATIMTDSAMADHIYIEPLNLETVERIIEKEKPDSVLSTLGGQTGLTLSMQLAKSGFLQAHDVQLLGARPETIDKAEDRQIFKDTMLSIGQPVVPSQVVNTISGALMFAEEIGYPVIVRPAFTLGGTGGGIAGSEEELKVIAEAGLRLSPITQILVERCIAGWKEIEFEVMRDASDNCITVCSMENMDPVGIHTGDSIVIAPAVTLSDKEYQMLRSAAIDIIRAMGIEGGCNVQFALNPESFEYSVIEVNPRVSRSSALASKATGYPIARVAAKIALGYTLDEITNEVTGRTRACFEPALDYVVVKFPKWPFDKFVYADRRLGTQMKATGEVMAIGQNFEEALMKAVRGAAISQYDLSMPSVAGLSDEDLHTKVMAQDDERLFALYESLRRGISVQTLHEETMIDEWFLEKLRHLCDLETRMKEVPEVDQRLYHELKKYGFPDRVIRKGSWQHEASVYQMVDTCGAEFAAETPYFYGTHGRQDEAAPFIRERNSTKPVVIVFGSGPIRIGQGIEFDYACVHCVWALQRSGYEVVIVNNNPETVSTDFNTADRLYFEPLTDEDVLDIVALEKPVGCVVAFGGQTAIKLTKCLVEHQIPIMGTPADSIDAAEDRGRFDAMLGKLGIKRAAGTIVHNEQEALKAANTLGYPVLMRPSYVLGGQNMIIAHSDEDITEYMKIILEHEGPNDVLIDKYLMGTELEVDAICDGQDVLIPGIMEHIERAGIHSGDSIAVYPPYNLTKKLTDEIIEDSTAMAMELHTRGLINIQYIAYEDQIYVIEVNPRSSRTVPYISKVTGVPMVDIATRIMAGEKLRDMGYGTGLYPHGPMCAVKVPVFSFEKLHNVDTQLGPEMKSTGEVLGVASTLEEALYKGLAAAGYEMKTQGGVLITVRDTDKDEIGPIARDFYRLGFKLYATSGTARLLRSQGMEVETVLKIHEGAVNISTLLDSGKVQYIISTSAKGRIPARDSVKIRRKAVELGIPCLTALDTARAMARSLSSRYRLYNMELIDMNHLPHSSTSGRFVKMQTAGNDYIVFDCFDHTIENPEALAVELCAARTGIGSYGMILIEPSSRADARMRLFTSDGQELSTSGNGVRCAGKYLYDSGRVRRPDLKVETISGVRDLTLEIYENKVRFVSVNLGPAKVEAEGRKLIENKRFTAAKVQLGGSHLVLFSPNVAQVDTSRLGQRLTGEASQEPDLSVEFVQVSDPRHLEAKVYEKGTGESSAFGTGASAAAAAAVSLGLCRAGEEISVSMPGGDVSVRQTPDGVILSGEVTTVFTGEVSI